MDWFDAFISKKLTEKTLLVAKLLADEHLGTENQRVIEFYKQGGGTRATYYRHLKKLQARSRKVKAMEIPLKGKRRPNLRIVGS